MAAQTSLLAQTARFAKLWAGARDSQGKARASASLTLADFCESIGDLGMAASARGWARNPHGAYIPYTPWSITIPQRSERAELALRGVKWAA